MLRETECSSKLDRMNVFLQIMSQTGHFPSRTQDERRFIFMNNNKWHTRPLHRRKLQNQFHILSGFMDSLDDVFVPFSFPFQLVSTHSMSETKAKVMRVSLCSLFGAAAPHAAPPSNCKDNCLSGTFVDDQPASGRRRSLFTPFKMTEMDFIFTQMETAVQSAIAA